MQFFYSKDLQGEYLLFSREESEHMQKIMRLKSGDEVQVLNGNGKSYRCQLETGKTVVKARILEVTEEERKPGGLHLWISPTKNLGRIEWMLEKITEIGLTSIRFVQTKRTERVRINESRLEKITISALKQSGQLFLPWIYPLTDFSMAIKNESIKDKYIAHCMDSALPHLADRVPIGKEIVVAIGPEGDFTKKEIDLALSNGFQEISLGSSRLRTETAGIFVSVVLSLVNRN